MLLILTLLFKVAEVTIDHMLGLLSNKIALKSFSRTTLP